MLAETADCILPLIYLCPLAFHQYHKHLEDSMINESDIDIEETYSIPFSFNDDTGCQTDFLEDQQCT